MIADPNSSSVVAKKKQLLNAAQSEETKKALAKQWRLFSIWSKDNKLKSFPCSLPVYEAYFIYLVDKGWKRASIEQARWAIDTWHRLNKQQVLSELTEIKLFFKGLNRSIGFKQSQKKELTIEHIKLMPFADDLMGLRDKLLLLIGFAGGLRRSELISLMVEDIGFEEYGMRIALRKSKTNQEGRNEAVDFTYAKDSKFCPVMTLKTWLDESGIKQGYVFRSFYRGQKLSSNKLSGHQVARLIKCYAAAIGMPKGAYSGHSLRAGCATYLLGKKVPLNIVAKQLRHKKIDTTMKYDRSEVGSALTGLY